jgi:GT2 family glycosyltransferase
MKRPRVAIILLNWNGIEDTLECLESLRALTYPHYDVIVVDNASDGNDVSRLREGFGDAIQVIENDRNYGFAAGSNIGIEYAISAYGADYFLLLNNDTVVDPGFLDCLVTTAESSAHIGIVAPKIYHYDLRGRSDVIWYAGGRTRWWRLWAYCHVGKDSDDLPRYQTVAEVDWASGAAMLIKRRTIEAVSLLNSSYFFGFEDMEYCFRAREHGFKIVYVPASRVWHKGGRSRAKRGPSPMLLWDYYRFVRRNFPVAVQLYHFLLLPVYCAGEVRYGIRTGRVLPRTFHPW